jgi:hypothetical protein
MPSRQLPPNPRARFPVRFGVLSDVLGANVFFPSYLEVPLSITFTFHDCVFPVSSTLLSIFFDLSPPSFHGAGSLRLDVDGRHGNQSITVIEAIVTE